MFNEDDRSLCLCREVKPLANLVHCDHCPMRFHWVCLVEAAEAAVIAANTVKEVNAAVTHVNEVKALALGADAAAAEQGGLDGDDEACAAAGEDPYSWCCDECKHGPVTFGVVEPINPAHRQVHLLNAEAPRPGTARAAQYRWFWLPAAIEV